MRILLGTWDDLFAASGVTQEEKEAVYSNIWMAAEMWDLYIDSDADIVVRVDFLDLPNDPLASAGPKSFSINGGPFTSEVIHQLQGNDGADLFDPNDPRRDASNIDARFNVDLSRLKSGEFYFDDDILNVNHSPSINDQFDFFVTAMHEIGHLLGMGAGITEYDNFVVNDGGNFYFTGPNAMSANGGQRVLLQKNDDGTINGHIADSADLLYFRQSSNFKSISALDVAILKDLGVPIEVVPQICTIR